ncbi:LPS export ABC transporter permease LptF [Geopsychrobacter electrodiphilus]|uniref:LPS export ABC transporter permease LptF n=1 Tax=Geopsychrobacter electrodiphilus TaxID=225196 RepID=UPI00035D9E8C|nr:LPS export ABC transporter permease LptF [Geopsychrobacter electrodiphilus]
MNTRRINRYIFNETLIPTLLGLVVFTFILVMGKLPGLTELVLNKGVPLISILKLFSYLLPTFLSITIPLSFLLGVLLAFGRLSADSEFIALKSTGVSLYTLLKPILYFSIVCVLITGYLTLYGEPLGKSAFRDQLFTIASDRAGIGIQAGVFNDSFEGLIIYAESTEDKQEQMTHVFISDERAAGNPANIIARQGQFIHDAQNKTLTLRLKDGTIHHLESGKTDSYQTVGFSTYDISLDLSKGLAVNAERSKSLGEYSPSQLISAKRQTTDKRMATRLAVELHKRISTSVAPLVFALIGIPLGLQSNRSGKGAGFSLALGIALSYYVLLNISATLASKGGVPPAFALYLPNLLFISAGILLINRTAREKQFSWPSLWGTSFFSRRGRAKK